MCVWLDRLLPKALMTKPKSAGKDGGKGSRGGGLIPEDLLAVSLHCVALS